MERRFCRSAGDLRGPLFSLSQQPSHFLPNCGIPHLKLQKTGVTTKVTNHSGLPGTFLVFVLKIPHPPLQTPLVPDKRGWFAPLQQQQGAHSTVLYPVPYLQQTPMGVFLKIYLFI